MTGETYLCCISGKNLRPLSILSKDKVEVGISPPLNPPQSNQESSRAPRSDDVLYFHPSCLLGFFLDFGSVAVDGLDEAWACALLDDADAWVAVMSALLLSIARCGISPAAFRA